VWAVRIRRPGEQARNVVQGERGHVAQDEKEHAKLERHAPCVPAGGVGAQGEKKGGLFSPFIIMTKSYDYNNDNTTHAVWATWHRRGLRGLREWCELNGGDAAQEQQRRLRSSSRGEYRTGRRAGSVGGLLPNRSLPCPRPLRRSFPSLSPPLRTYRAGTGS
jgi:hypothetical protein